MNRLRLLLMVTPALALVGCFVLGPALLLIRVSLYRTAEGRGFYTPGTMTFANFLTLLDPSELRIIGFTACFGTLVAVLVVVIGFPLALFLRTLHPRWQLIALTLIVIPKTAGLLSTFFGLQRWLPRGMFAAVVGEVYLILPYVVLILYVQQASIRPILMEAAGGLGATAWQAFRRVTVPLSVPGLIVAFQLGLMWGLGAFLGPLFLGSPNEATLSVELHRQAFEYGRWPRASAEAVCLLVMLTLAVTIGRRSRVPEGG